MVHDNLEVSLEREISSHLSGKINILKKCIITKRHANPFTFLSDLPWPNFINQGSVSMKTIVKLLKKNTNS